MAIRAADRDVSEGADMLMVKPAMAYLDILKTIKGRYPEYPMFVYQVSGEYSMIYSGAQAGVFELKAVLMEILGSFRRAGKLSCNFLCKGLTKYYHFSFSLLYKVVGLIFSLLILLWSLALVCN